MLAHQASRNFVIKALSFLHHSPSPSEEKKCHSNDRTLLKSPGGTLISILVTCSRFMNGSLSPEIFMNFALELPDVYFLRTVCRFSHTLQFTNALRVSCSGTHVYDRYLHFDPKAKPKTNKQYRIIEAPPTIDILFYKLIRRTRYFMRQLVHLDFHSDNSYLCYQVFTKCLPKLTALRHLRFRFPFQHCIDDLDQHYRAYGCSEVPASLAESQLMSTWTEKCYENFCDYEQGHSSSSSSSFSASSSDDDFDSYEIDKACMPVHACKVLGCVLHPDDDIVINEYEFVESLENLTNLESLELVVTPQPLLATDALQQLFEVNPMWHLRKLTLTIFPLSFAARKKSIFDAFEDRERSFDFSAISNYLPQLQSLAIHKMPLIRTRHGRDILPDLRDMKNLEELFLYGVTDSSGLERLVGKHETDEQGKPQFSAVDYSVDLPCCPRLRRLSLGGLDMADWEASQSVVESNLLRFFKNLSSAVELQHIDMCYLRRNIGSADGWFFPHRERTYYSEPLLQLWLETFPMIERYSLETAFGLTDSSLKLVGDCGGSIKRLVFSRLDNTLFTDSGISHLFDPEKAKSEIFTSLEYLSLAGRDITCEGWFGSFLPDTQLYALKTLVLEKAGRMSVEGLIQILFGFSQCLEHFECSVSEAHQESFHKSILKWCVSKPRDSRHLARMNDISLLQYTVRSNQCFRRVGLRDQRVVDILQKIASVARFCETGNRTIFFNPKLNLAEASPEDDDEDDDDNADEDEEEEVEEEEEEEDGDYEPLLKMPDEKYIGEEEEPVEEEEEDEI